MPALEILAIALAMPGAIAALGDLWTLRAVGRRDPRPSTTVLDISFHFSVRRTRARPYI